MDTLDALMQALASGADGDTVAKLVAEADAAADRDNDWMDYQGGGEAAGVVHDAMQMSDLVIGRVPEAVCQAAGCFCPTGPTGKTVHMGWIRRPVQKVITKYQTD